MDSVFSLKASRDRLGLLRTGRFPVAAFVGIVAVVCLGLLLSAGHSYVTLSRLRIQYPHNRALEIATAADVQVRGPGRRNNPDYWQEALQGSVDRDQAEVSFMALLGRDGAVLAAAGDSSAAANLESGQERRSWPGSSTAAREPYLLLRSKKPQFSRRWKGTAATAGRPQISLESAFARFNIA